MFPGHYGELILSCIAVLDIPTQCCKVHSSKLVCWLTVCILYFVIYRKQRRWMYMRKHMLPSVWYQFSILRLLEVFFTKFYFGEFHEILALKSKFSLKSNHNNSHSHDSFRNPSENRSELKMPGADKSLARTGRKQATATEDFDVHISYL
jgi:hypothetical protein